MDKLLRPAPAPAPPCCDLHGRNCEQGGDECCERCTEAHHFDILPPHGGLLCSRPNLSGWTL